MMHAIDCSTHGQKKITQHKSKGRSCAELKEEAVARWQEVLKLKPDDLETKLNIAKLHSEIGELGEASIVFEELVSRYTGDSILLREYALHLGRQALFSEARQAWEQVYDIEKSSDVLFNIAKLYIQEEQCDKALKIADKIENSFSDTFRCNMIRGKAYFQNENWNNAIKAWNSILQVKKKHYEAELKLLISMRRLGLNDELLRFVNKSIENHPKSETFYTIKYRSLVQTDKEKALEFIKSTSLIFPDSLEWVVEEVKLLLLLERLREAEISCENAVKASPNNIELLTLYARIAQKMVCQFTSD